MGLSAVFSLCARSVGQHLPGVLRNVDALAALYDRTAFVFVENDSDDDTKALLKAWAAERPDATLLELDGLEARGLKRTDRIGVCRNAYMDFIRGSPLVHYDHLVMLDADGVNRPPIDVEGFARGRDWLEEHRAAAVFANSQPFYYDVYALRHPTWCPRNWSTDIRERPAGMSEEEARQRFVSDRQILIPRTAEPIEVTSAFGGLAIYRMADALAGRYVGLSEHGGQVCEHVGFNQDIVRAGGRLFILPWMMAPSRGAGIFIPPDARTMTLSQGDRSCELYAPADHGLEALRQENPLYGRRWPVLARLLGDVVPGTVAIDLSAGIGDGIALCRLEGARLGFLAVEPSLRKLKYLALNQAGSRDLFANVQIAWHAVGPPGDMAQGDLDDPPGSPSPLQAPLATLEEVVGRYGIRRRLLSLVKLDTEGFDIQVLGDGLAFLQTAAPVLWTRAQSSTADDDAAWDRWLRAAAEGWPHVVAFDHQGFALAAGETAGKRQTIVDVLAYARRHNSMKTSNFGERTIQSLEIALFPARFASVYEAFRRELPELGDA